MIENIGVFTFINGHTVKCRERQEQQAEAHEQYVRKHPNYCMSCGGTGLFHHNVVENNTVVSVTTDCFCVEFFTCPRCGEELGGLSCLHCQFVLGQTHGCPPKELDCFCEYLYNKLKEGE